MIVELAAKLRLTAAALGCGSRKELCARFRAVNTASQVDLDRLHKWLQGRASPRSPTVLADWHVLLELEDPPVWLADCSAAELGAVLERRAGLEPDTLGLRAAQFGRRGRATVPAAATNDLARFLCGVYATYSYAWSPYFACQLIRGALMVSPAAGSGLSAIYSERFAEAPLRLRGRLRQTSQVLQAALEGSIDHYSLFLTLNKPGWPASALCGVLSGSSFAGHRPAPTATRIVLVRLPGIDLETAERSNRYLHLERETPAGDLAALGMPSASTGAVDALVLDLLARMQDGPVDHVEETWQARLAALFDPLQSVWAPLQGACTAPSPIAVPVQP